MPYFKITPHPLLVEAEDAADAVQKAHALYRAAAVQRYEAVGPDAERAWVEARTDTAVVAQDAEPLQTDEPDAAAEHLEPIQAIEPATAAKTPGRFGRFVRTILS